MTNTLAFPALDECRARATEDFFLKMTPAPTRTGQSATNPTEEGRERCSLELAQEKYRFKTRALKWLLGSLRTVASGDLSRSILPPMEYVDMRPDVTPACGDDVPTATFYAPLDYGWSEAEYEVEKAVKEYLEASHADR